MSNELLLKTCSNSGALVRIMKAPEGAFDGNDKILVPNSVDASFEKHVPTYEVVGDEIVAKVNHVMEEDHYIEWLAMFTDKREELVKFVPGETAEAVFKYVPGAKLYAYCNKHGLWMAEVK